MSVLTIRRGNLLQQLSFDEPKPLSQLLQEADASLPQPCGGRGICGKCAVILSGNVSEPTPAEMRFGVRLACQAIITGDVEVSLPTLLPMEQIAEGSRRDILIDHPLVVQYGAAIDIGTTTLALLLYDLTTGRCLSAASMLNPQTAVAADVIGRIDAAMKGQSAYLQRLVEEAIRTLLVSACAQADIPSDSVSRLTITGNTTMLYLLSGYDPAALSHAPFEADHLFAEEAPILGRSAYLPPCLHAFVGADTTCALLSSGMMKQHQTALLCDVGTNGELALWHRGKLYIASTAAGPAFEGAGISCGCSSIPGAIDQVRVEGNALHCHTIGDRDAVGICGSGLVDAISALLTTGDLDETGFLEDDPIPLTGTITLNQADIRAVQLAKAAIYAGIISLLDAAACHIDDVEAMYLAGGFGSHLNLDSAVHIGLFPAELADRVHIIGNAALDGAAMLLASSTYRQEIMLMKAAAHHVRLDGNPVFAENYISAMLFGDE